MNTMRQQGLISNVKLNDYNYTIIGCGGLGSPTCVVLTKMGVQNISLFDGDTVEDHNLPNQYYREEDLGQFKVNSLKDICVGYNHEVKITTYEKFFEETDKGLIKNNGILISCVDDIDVRKMIFESTVKFNPLIPLYIDMRMGGLAGEIISINPLNPDHIREYETEKIFPKNEAYQERCTEKAIIFNVITLAGFLGSVVRNFIMTGNMNDISNCITVDMKNFNVLKYNF